MAKRNADSGTVRLIYKLAGDPSQVAMTTTATGHMFALGLNIYEICEAIQEWIDAKKPIEQDATKHVSKYKGKPIYILKPSIGNCGVYLKVQVSKNRQTGKHLLIISSHQLY